MGDCGHIPGSKELEIWRSGTYFVSYNVYHDEPFQCAIFLNNNLVVGSLIGDQNSGTVVLNGILLEILPGDINQPSSLSPSNLSAKITLRNHSSFSPVGVLIDGHEGSGSQTGQTNVNVILYLIE